MFHKAQTEKERQKIFDDYLLGILQKKQIIKKNQKIIDEGEFSFDPSLNEDKVKGAFNSYVDSLVIKNFLIEQIYTRLKISKTIALNFVNKLDGNQVLILSKVINEFIKDIQETYTSINDYILKTSFDSFQSNYKVAEQQALNNQIVAQNQIEEGQLLQENIPADELQEAEAEPETGDEEAKNEGVNLTFTPTKKKKRKPIPRVFKLGGPEKDTGKKTDEDDEDEQKQRFVEFIQNTIFKIDDLTTKKIILENLNSLIAVKQDYDVNKKFTRNEKINNFFIANFIPLIDNEEKRLTIQKAIRNGFLMSDNISDANKRKYGKLFPTSQLFEGSGGYGIVKQKKKSQSNDDYIPIGKYKAHKTKLMGGKLQIRSNNNNQVYNLKSQVISTNIRDILLKLNKGESINYKDVDNLSIDEKNQLYTIGKKLHISQLFDIPSTLKSEEEKLVSDFLKLRGSLMAGNNSKELLREFKINILKMKNNKLISLQEYNEVLNILLDMDF
jgi:hypothetical protein